MSPSRSAQTHAPRMKWLVTAALLVLPGGGLVLALVAATMYLTRRIDWYAFGATLPPELPTPAEQAS